ncbi:hypothetical protein [Streptomyces noursei]|uniref:hypothetical protein n=1 Tax=Streptomyces noursei TaxID=1971 RepID=UPI003BF53AB8
MSTAPPPPKAGHHLADGGMRGGCPVEAAVDRLLHHAHVVLTEGSSLRLTQATSGQGVVALNQPS